MTRATDDVIGQLVSRAVEERVVPGAVWAVGDADGPRLQAAHGLLDPDEQRVATRVDTVFDVASLTKIVSVWAVVGALREAGDLAVDAPLERYLPDVRGYPLGDITVHHLLTHTAGVPLRANLRSLYGTDRRAVERGVLQERLHRPPGQAVEYTDRAALILGFLVERLTGQPLDQLSRACAWDALNMTTTTYGPLPAELAARCAPTERDDSGSRLRGTPHDYSARLLRVCGSAGVFSDVSDLGAFLRYLIAPDDGPRRPAFGPAWIKESLRIQTGDLTPSRGLFWHPAPGSRPADDIWAHFGFTGTAMWVSPRLGRWAVLLTNKVYYTRDGGPIHALRTAFCRYVFGVPPVPAG